jgi:tryptophan 2-C-methyltransferase
MLTLINANRMTPPIAPVGLDYVAGAARRKGIDVEILDLCLADDPDDVLAKHFTACRPELVGVSFRNVDDCFWPGAAWFVPDLVALVKRIKALCDAPIVLGGVGFSIFAARIVEATHVDFGIRGDGEAALVELLAELRTGRQLQRVDGLLWWEDGTLRANRPAWPEKLCVPTERNALDNTTYFRLGGQIGLETKRGCSRRCSYCADPLAKGSTERLRDPVEVADEVESLLARGIDVLHLCDSEFNVPVHHARAVCNEFIRRRFDGRLRWYCYMAAVPFDAELARLMRRAGCVGINFTSDSACPKMLKLYCQPQRKEDLATLVAACRASEIAVMLDLLLGGPGETPASVEETIRFVQQIGPDCAGTALGIRLYPDIPMRDIVAAEAPFETNPGIYRCYDGPVDLLRPTFYVSPALGQRPSQLVQDLIAGDVRFFEPKPDVVAASDEPEPEANYNYSDNQPLVDAIAGGARGAYWDILRRLRSS